MFVVGVSPQASGRVAKNPDTGLAIVLWVCPLRVGASSSVKISSVWSAGDGMPAPPPVTSPSTVAV